MSENSPTLKAVLFRPPRYVWPFNSETSAFWQPLGLLSLAATARRDVPGADVKVYDCPANRWGWRTARTLLGAQRIDVFGIGEETVSAHEGLRAAALVKALHPDCLVVAGGPYYAHTIDTTLQNPSVDVVVRGEGEQTFVELLRCLADQSDWPTIPGIAFRDGQDEPVTTPRRELITDLDSLPFPAYDLLDMDQYGRGSRNHPGLVSVEHSRGCIDSCSFCILWKHMGRQPTDSAKVQPCYRTQSPQRSFDTVSRLYRDFGRRTFGWVDPTFNASPRWSDEWANLMLRSQLMGRDGRPCTLHTAWMRADCVLRDEKLGILEKLVHAGLRQVMIGVERDDEAGLAQLNKHQNGAGICREAFTLFRRKYPEVFTIGTVIYGLPGDTMADLKRLAACRHEMQMDYCFVMPLTPNPGTQVAEDAQEAHRIASDDLACYNFHTPVSATDTLSPRRQESIYWRTMFLRHHNRWARLVWNLFREPDRRKRRVFFALLRHGTFIGWRCLVRSVTQPFSSTPALYSRKPTWYDQ